MAVGPDNTVPLAGSHEKHDVTGALWQRGRMAYSMRSWATWTFLGQKIVGQGRYFGEKGCIQAQEGQDFGDRLFQCALTQG